MTTTSHENSTRKRLVIRISRHSLAMAVQDIDDLSVPLAYTPYTIKGTMSITANLREAMKTLEIFSRDYTKVMVMVDTLQLVVPLDVYKESDSTLLYTHCYPDTGNSIVKDDIIGDINVAVHHTIAYILTQANQILYTAHLPPSSHQHTQLKFTFAMQDNFLSCKG